MIEHIRGAYEREIPGFRASLEEAFDIDNAGRKRAFTPEKRAAIIDHRLSLSVGRLIQGIADLPKVGARVRFSLLAPRFRKQFK